MKDEQKQKILVVDDDRKLCRLTQDYLEQMGYGVVTAYSGKEGLCYALDSDFHALILDIMMPEMDGFEVLRELRKEKDTPVLVLTARGDETDRIVGLELGADDYLPKTFSHRELLARLRAVIRRSTSGRRRYDAKPDNETLSVGTLEINVATRYVSLEGKSLNLTAIEFELLLTLARVAGRALSRDMLLEAVAGRQHEVYDRSIDVHISSLRRKIGDDPRHPKFIKTVRSIGYMLIV